MSVITIDGKRYLIRGTGYTAKDLRRLYVAYKTKYPTYQGTLLQWATTNGKIYTRLDRK